MAQTPQTTQPGAPAQKSEGLEWVFRTLAPKGQEQAWADHYKANKNAWNLGIGAGLGLTTAALANGATNAFGGNNNNNNGGGGSGWGWLAPMALGAGGMWLWNKYGKQAIDLFNDVKKTKDAAAQTIRGAGDSSTGVKQALKGTGKFLLEQIPGVGAVYRAYNGLSGKNTGFDDITQGISKAYSGSKAVERAKQLLPPQKPTALAQNTSATKPAANHAPATQPVQQSAAPQQHPAAPVASKSTQQQQPRPVVPVKLPMERLSR